MQRRCVRDDLRRVNHAHDVDDRAPEVVGDEVVSGCVGNLLTGLPAVKGGLRDPELRGDIGVPFMTPGSLCQQCGGEIVHAERVKSSGVPPAPLVRS
jgi:hypothetical protein